MQAHEVQMKEGLTIYDTSLTPRGLQSAVIGPLSPVEWALVMKHAANTDRVESNTTRKLKSHSRRDEPSDRQQ